MSARQFLHSITVLSTAPGGRIGALSFHTIDLADLPFTGTPSGTLFACGDGTWKAVPPLANGDYGAIVVSGSGLTWTLQTNIVGNSNLRQSAGLSLIGRSANSTGDVADITAGTDGQVLRRSGTSIAFGQVDVNSSNAVTGLLKQVNGGTGANLTATGGSGQYLKQVTAGAAVTVGVIPLADLPALTVAVLPALNGFGDVAPATGDRIPLYDISGAVNGDCAVSEINELSPGHIYGRSCVATQESTTSTGAVDLTTTQSVTFTLAATTSVLIFGFAGAVNTTATGRAQVIYADVDGTDTAIASAGNFSTSLGTPIADCIEKSLAAGSHTIKLQFASASGGTAFFDNRALVVMRAN